MRWTQGKYLVVRRVPTDLFEGLGWYGWSEPFTKVGQTFYIEELEVMTHFMEWPVDILLKMVIRDIETDKVDAVTVVLYYQAGYKEFPNFPKCEDMCTFQEYISCVSNPNQ